jgi:ssDNA-binding Zn-finger/Zn-ribbon topoisomerase 1
MTIAPKFRNNELVSKARLYYCMGHSKDIAEGDLKDWFENLNEDQLNENHFCSNCGDAFVVKYAPSRQRYFLGCTSYPYCILSADVPPSYEARAAEFDRNATYDDSGAEDKTFVFPPTFLKTDTKKISKKNTKEDKEDTTMPTVRTKKTLKESLGTVIDSNVTGLHMALTDKAGNTMLDGAAVLAAKEPWIAEALKSPLGREFIKSGVSTGLLIAAETTDLLPKPHIFSRLAKGQISYSSAKLSGTAMELGLNVLALLQPHLEALVGIGEQLEKLEAKGLSEDAESAEELPRTSKSRSASRV